MRKLIPVIAIFALIFTSPACMQRNIELKIEGIYQNSLQSEKSYEMLKHLCSETPGRLSGTSQSERAITFVKETMIKYGADSVWLVPVLVPGWIEIKRPVTEVVIQNRGRIGLNSVSLGQSISTQGNGIDAQLVTIENKTQIDSLGENGIKGKIVFFNGKMKIRSDYGKMAWQRTQGASLVSKYGAIGVIVRSLTTKKDDNPHTGVVRYDENLPKIPAVALSWQASDSLENLLKDNPELMFHLETYCENRGFVPSFNVVGEIKGSKYPNEILLLSGHLDAWHNAQGAQDDGGGVSQIVDVLRIYKELHIRPKHTIRIMPYMDEEQYNSGMKQYAELTANQNQKQIYEIEVDHGIGIPAGFDIQCDSAVFTNQDAWRKFLIPSRLNYIRFSGRYAMDWPLYKTNKTILSHFSCVDDHYFDYHHSANDVFESVDKNSLQSGSAALASFIYILDEMDVIDNSKRKD